MVLIIQHQQKQQHHLKEVAEIVVHEMDVVEVKVVHVVLMALHRRKVERIELQQQRQHQLLINKLTIHIKNTMLIIVYIYKFLIFVLIMNSILFSLDYNQAGQSGNGAPWYYDKQNKRKKKLEGTLDVDPNAQTEDGTNKSFRYFLL